MTDQVASINQGESQVFSAEKVAARGRGRPSMRTEAQDALYFEARSHGKSKHSSAIIAGYNYYTILTTWAKLEDWAECEAMAWEMYLDNCEDVVVEDEKINPAAARKALEKHRKARFGVEATEVKVTHVVDIEGALNDIAKLSGVADRLEAPGAGVERPNSAGSIMGDFTVVGEGKT